VSDPSALTALIFDLDGVLVDSRVPITACLNHALAEVGLAAEPEAALRRWIGPPLREAFTVLLAERGADPALTDVCVEHYRARYGSVSLTETRVMPGIEEALAALAPHYRLAVATSKPAAFAVPILDRLGLAGWFRSLAAAPLVDTHAEPKSATVARALAGVGLGPPAAGAPPSAAMIGDRHLDVEAGRRWGLLTIGVTWGIGDVAELRGAGADLLVASPGELTARLAEARARAAPSATPRRA